MSRFSVPPVTRALSWVCLMLWCPALGIAQGTGTVNIDLTNTAGQSLPCKVVFVSEDGSSEPISVIAEKGQLETTCPPGSYTAFVYTHDLDVPLLVHMKNVEVKPGETAFVLVNLDEGSGPNFALREFDRDQDLVLDRVELAAGSDPDDPSSYPGGRPAPFVDTVLSEEAGWYRGALHVRSQHGGGKESVAKLIRRAEKAKLDFLAITDRNTMAACEETAFNSKSLVLIPAMEWGNDERGVALIYGPRTFPEQVDNWLDAQAVVYRVQAQGGLFAVAHPCFPNAPWQWGLGFVNAVEVWCRGWREVPPLVLDSLGEEYKTRDKDGKLIHSMAQAAVTPRYSPPISANQQAEMFWDSELRRGLKAGLIAGSLSSSPKVGIDEPITYVYAEQKSVSGILDGLRQGRTYVSSGRNGPRISFQADVLEDELIDVNIGGVVPIGVPVAFHINVIGAAGCKVQLLRDGLPAVTKIAEKNNIWMGCSRKPTAYSTYRVRVIATSPKGMSHEKWMTSGFGELDVVAMTGPIYAQDMILIDEKMDPADMWVKLVNKNMPPLFADPERQSPTGRALVRPDVREILPTDDDFEARETIVPQWRY